MLPVQKYRWLYRIIRANTTQIPESTAFNWKRSLSFVYVVSAFGIFAMAQEMTKAGKKKGEQHYGVENEAHYWLQKEGKKEAVIVRFSGLDFANATTEEYSYKKMKEEEEAGVRKPRLAGDPESNCGVPGCEQPTSS